MCSKIYMIPESEVLVLVHIMVKANITQPEFYSTMSSTFKKFSKWLEMMITIFQNVIKVAAENEFGNKCHDFSRMKGNVIPILKLF